MRRVVTWLKRILFSLVLMSLALVILYRFVAPPVTPLMVLRTVEGIVRSRPVGVNRDWVDLEHVSPALLRSVIAAEDARFFLHGGIDLQAVEQARDYNALQAGRRRRGASTITMQCARSVFLWQGRNWVRKALEVYFALWQELVWGKRRILEVYVNTIEWGPGIYGVEAAARRYFGVAASQLDARQAALLAAALPNPRRWNPAAPTPYLRGRAAIIEARAAHVGLSLLRLARSSMAR